MRQYEVVTFEYPSFSGTLPAGWEPFAYSTNGIIARRRLGWRERVPLGKTLPTQPTADPGAIQAVKIR